MTDPRWLEHLALILGYRWRAHRWPDHACSWKAILDTQGPYTIWMSW